MELHEKSAAEQDTQLDSTLTEESAMNADSIAVSEETTANTATEEKASGSEPTTKAEIVEILREIARKDPAEIGAADETGRLKQLFYALHNADLRRLHDEYVAAGNDPETFTTLPDPLEDEFKELINTIKEKRSELRAAIEAERENNLERKRAIIDELNAMADDTDNVNRHYQRVKELQAEFKSIGEVPPTESTDIWKQWQESVERFYDRLKINMELRDYDFKKNLAEKQLIIAEAQSLKDEEDIIAAFRRLQELHGKWRETGPVAKDVREEIWNTFKDASADINKRYQAFFEERKARENENEAAKTALCERIESLDFSAISSYKAWDEMTSEIINLQNEWKKIGFASRKVNNKLFSRFRDTCDKFFSAKAEFFKTMKEELAENLRKKIALCEQAEQLAESTEWRSTTDKLIELQRQWKTIGAVPKKHSENVWKRFLTACDSFFDRKKQATSGTRKAEQENLKIKRDLIERLKAIGPDTPRDEAIATVKEVQAKWRETGHVPFKEKDSLHEAYRTLTGDLYKSLDIRGEAARMNSFENSLNEMMGDDNKMFRERDRLVRIFEQRRSELNTYENNLGFFNSKTKTGDSMLRDMERKIQRLKEDIATLESKIKMIDAKL